MYGCVGGRDATDAYGSSGRNVLGFLPDIIALCAPELRTSEFFCVVLLSHFELGSVLSQGVLQVHWSAFLEGKDVA